LFFEIRRQSLLIASQAVGYKISFAEMFKCENILLINFDAEQDVEKKGQTIHIVPAAEWLSRNRWNWGQ
jgi:hypothetical protein